MRLSRSERQRGFEHLPFWFFGFLNLFRISTFGFRIFVFCHVVHSSHPALGPPFLENERGGRLRRGRRHGRAHRGPARRRLHAGQPPRPRAGRLGRIDEVLVADHFFREQLADEKSSGSRAAPAILYSASLETVDPAPPARMDQVNLIGCDQRFWELGNGNPPAPLKRDEIILNEPVARSLGLKEGDSVMLDLPKTGGIPAESAFGRKRVSVDTMRLKVARVIPAEGLGRFGLRPNQRVPRNAYVSLAALQTQLQEPGRANAIFRPKPSRRPALASAIGRLRHPRRAFAAGLCAVDDRPDDLPAGRRAGPAQATWRNGRAANLDLSGQQHHLRKPGSALLDHHGDRLPGQAALRSLRRCRGLSRAQTGRRSNRLEHLGCGPIEGQGGRHDPRRVLRAREHVWAASRAHGRSATGGDREARRGRRRQGPHADRSRPDRQEHDRRLGSAFRDPAGTDQAGRRPLLEPVRRNAQGVRLAGHGAAAVGEPFRADDRATDSACAGRYGGKSRPRVRRTTRPRPGGTGVRLPADQGTGPQGRGRHNALRSAFPVFQFLRNCRGGNARRALIPFGDRATCETRRAALGPGVSSPADHAASGGRGPVGGPRGKPRRHTGWSGLRGAHALRAANLVAARHRHALPHVARLLGKPCDGAGQRPADGLGGDLACRTPHGPNRPAAVVGRRSREGGGREAEKVLSTQYSVLSTRCRVSCSSSQISNLKSQTPRSPLPAPHVAPPPRPRSRHDTPPA